MWTFLFLENWQFNQKLCPLFPANILKDSPQNLTKYEIKGIWKISISWKSQNNPEKSPQKIPKHLKNSPQNLTKYEVKGISKLSISLLFSELRKIQNYKELGKCVSFWEKKRILKPLRILHIPRKKISPFDVLPKQRTCEMKALQVQVFIQQWFHDGQGTKFM